MPVLRRLAGGGAPLRALRRSTPRARPNVASALPQPTAAPRVSSHRGRNARNRGLVVPVARNAARRAGSPKSNCRRARTRAASAPAVGCRGRHRCAAGIRRHGCGAGRSGWPVDTRSPTWRHEAFTRAACNGSSTLQGRPKRASAQSAGAGRRRRQDLACRRQDVRAAHDRDGRGARRAVAQPAAAAGAVRQVAGSSSAAPVCRAADDGGSRLTASKVEGRAAAYALLLVSSPFRLSPTGCARGLTAAVGWPHRPFRVTAAARRFADRGAAEAPIFRRFRLAGPQFVAMNNQELVRRRRGIELGMGLPSSLLQESCNVVGRREGPAGSGRCEAAEPDEADHRRRGCAVRGYLVQALQVAVPLIDDFIASSSHAVVGRVRRRSPKASPGRRGGSRGRRAAPDGEPLASALYTGARPTDSWSASTPTPASLRVVTLRKRWPAARRRSKPSSCVRRRSKLRAVQAVGLRARRAEHAGRQGTAAPRPPHLGQRGSRQERSRARDRRLYFASLVVQ